MEILIRSVGEAHIGLTRFFKSNKARAVHESSTKKIVQQPKSIGLSKRAVLKGSSALSDSKGGQTSLPMIASQLSGSQPAIGVGQSYVNPQLLRHPPDSEAIGMSVVVLRVKCDTGC